MGGSLRAGSTAVSLLLSLAGPVTPAAPQWRAEVTAAENAGIRRTSFPATARMEIPAGRIERAGQLRLMDGDTEVAAQGTAWSTWPDGSVKELELDFNVSLAPLETRVLQLRYGSEDSPGSPPGQGLSVVEEAEGVRAGRVGFGRGGSPLLRSVAYRNELVVREGRNGLAVTDDSGTRYGGEDITWSPAELLKRGPVTVLVRYRGRLELSGGSSVGVAMDLEMPNSKSWVKIAAVISDPDRRVRDLAIETPLHVGAYPWIWDFGTSNGTYGVFRDPQGSVILTQTVDTSGGGTWQVLAGAAGEERPYERSAPGRSSVVRGWAHMFGGEEGVAFAIEGLGGTAGTLTAQLEGTGQTSFRFAPAEPTSRQSLTIYQHYVSTPMPIGAATSPASILSPIRVVVEPAGEGPQPGG